MLKLNTLIGVEKRLFEAETFASRLRLLEGDQFSRELNAFLSSVRSVTFVLQKEMKNSVPGFAIWWKKQQELMKNDLAMKFFVELRNISEKEGEISLVGALVEDPNQRIRTVYYFASNAILVPEQLAGHDVVFCCFEHLGKLAKIILEFSKVFPEHSCYRRAVTREGLKKLDLNNSDILKFLGYSKDWAAAAKGIPYPEVCRILRDQLDGVDFENIERIANNLPKDVDIANTLSNRLSVSLAKNLSRGPKVSPKPKRC